jgi:hypothetical protein
MSRKPEVVVTYVEEFNSSPVKVSFRGELWATLIHSYTQIHTFQVLQISNSIIIVIQHLDLETSSEYRVLLSAEIEMMRVLE